MKNLFVTLFLIGECVRLNGYDSWEKVTHHIRQVGVHSYLTEMAVQQSNGWSFGGSAILSKKEKGYSKVECPDINWDK